MLDLRFDSSGLIPVIAQDARTGQALMLAYANREAVTRTLASGWAHYFSRERATLWKKGETSGNVQRVVEVVADCDGDALLYRVEPAGPACHTGAVSCFSNSLFRPGQDDTPAAGPGQDETPMARPARDEEPGALWPEVLAGLWATIVDRARRRPSGSYVAQLLGDPPEKVLRKVGEEALELILAGLGGGGQDEVIKETADLWFFSLVALARLDLAPSQVGVELARRADPAFGKEEAGC